MQFALIEVSDDRSVIIDAFENACLDDYTTPVPDEAVDESAFVWKVASERVNDFETPGLVI
jgi:hypothetical protein